MAIINKHGKIWNNVFIQYNRKKDGSLEPLPSTHVDTGMGLERLVRVLQGKTSNYDTDIFSGTIQQVEVITGKKYDSSDTREAVAFRVLADHIRAISFTIADGQLPSNTGAGYVIRRILRRAVRYYYSYLDYKRPLLFQLMPLLAKQFEHVFPELNQQLEFVTKVIKEEEEGFLRTLEKGLKRMDDIIHTQAKNSVVEGQLVFELFDTFGFPVDLTRLIASENELSIDEAGFEKEMQQQKDRSRAATAIDTGDWMQVGEDVVTSFIGYTSTEATTPIVKYRSVKAKGKEAYQWVLATTPFYAESGGQVGDKGHLTFEDGTVLAVTDTKKENNLLKNKHIPQIYLRTSIEQRMELLRGLMDTDGSITKNQSFEFYQKNYEFILQVVELLSSLGIKSRVSRRLINQCWYHTVRFPSKENIFNLPRKSELINFGGKGRPQNKRHYIQKIEK